jgi:hypothetical protein
MSRELTVLLPVGAHARGNAAPRRSALARSTNDYSYRVPEEVDLDGDTGYNWRITISQPSGNTMVETV